MTTNETLKGLEIEVRLVTAGLQTATPGSAVYLALSHELLVLRGKLQVLRNYFRDL